MATTVDIIVRAKDSQLDRLQRKMERLGKITKSADNAINALDRELTKLGTNAGMDAAIRDIDIYRGKLAQARQAAKALARQNIGATGAGSASAPSGGGGSAGDGGGGGFAALGGIALLEKRFSNQFPVKGKKFEKAVAGVKKELQESSQFAEKISDATDRVEIANGKIADQFKKQSNRAAEVDKAQRALNAAAGQQKRLQSALKSGRIKEKDAIKKTKIEIAKLGADMTGYKNQIKSANAAIRQHKQLAEGLAPEFAQAKQELMGMETSLDRQARTIAKNRAQGARKGAVAQSAAAGLAFANIPGQDIFQAAGAGALIGGPKGAAISAGVAAIAKLTIGMANLSKETAKTFSEISRFETALRNVTGTEFQSALAAIERAVEDFNLPFKDSIQFFTQISAAANSAGFSLAETEQVFRGLAAANKALGGDTERLRGILLATTQVFSKGRVSAEELRGQIGERLAGAFSDFATASGISTAELDKNLERGEVRLEQFVKFSEFLLKKYEEDAKKIADGPDEAGQRLANTMERLTRVVGPALRDLGALFQNFASDVLDALIPLAEKINEIFDLGSVAQKIERNVQKVLQLNEKIFDIRTKIALTDDNQARKTLQFDLDDLIKKRDRLQDEINKLRDLQGKAKPPQRTDRTVTGGDEGDPKTFDRDQQRALREALSASDRRVELELSNKLVELEQKRLEALMAQDEELANRIEQLKAKGRAAAEVQKIEERIAILQQTASTLTPQELTASGIENQLLEERNRLAIAFNEAELVGLRYKQESVTAIQDQIKATNELIARTIELAGVTPVIDPQTGRPTGFLPPEQTFTQGRRDELQRLQNVGTGGEDYAQFFDNIRRMVTEDGMSFNEAFDLETLIRNTRIAQEQAKALQDDFKNLARSIGSELASAMETALVDTLTAAIQGADDLGESLQRLASDLLTSIGKIMVQAGLSMFGNANQGNIFGQLFGTRASGGPVNQNTPYIVGERGPELFVPGQSGTIMSNDAFSDAADAMTVTAQAFSDSGEAMTMASAAYGDGAAAASSTQAMVAVEQHISSGKSTVAFETYRVGEMDVVTREEAIKIGIQSAKQAEANVYKGMRNMPSVRARTGAK